MHIVHGRPRHPQSQGLIERANAILTDALGNTTVYNNFISKFSQNEKKTTKYLH